MGAFSVFTGSVYLLVSPPTLAQATPPRNRLRGHYAFAIFNFGIISCFVAEENHL
jgi:hypothetical protein